MAVNELQPHLFTGRWIGETQEYAMRAHIWEITQQGYGLMISTRWEGDTKVASFFWQAGSQPGCLYHFREQAL